MSPLSPLKLGRKKKKKKPLKSTADLSPPFSLRMSFSEMREMDTFTKTTSGKVLWRRLLKNMLIIIIFWLKTPFQNFPSLSLSFDESHGRQKCNIELISWVWVCLASLAFINGVNIIWITQHPTPPTTDIKAGLHSILYNSPFYVS